MCRRMPKIAIRPWSARPAPRSISSTTRRASCSAKRSNAAPAGGLLPPIRCRPVSDRTGRVPNPDGATHSHRLLISVLKPGRAVLKFHTSALWSEAPWTDSSTTRTSVITKSCLKQRRTRTSGRCCASSWPRKRPRKFPGGLFSSTTPNVGRPERCRRPAAFGRV